MSSPEIENISRLSREKSSSRPTGDCMQSNWCSAAAGCEVFCGRNMANHAVDDRFLIKLRHELLSMLTKALIIPKSCSNRNCRSHPTWKHYKDHSTADHVLNSHTHIASGRIFDRCKWTVPGLTSRHTLRTTLLLNPGLPVRPP